MLAVVVLEEETAVPAGVLVAVLAVGQEDLTEPADERLELSLLVLKTCTLADPAVVGHSRSLEDLQERDSLQTGTWQCTKPKWYQNCACSADWARRESRSRKCRCHKRWLQQ